MVCERRVDNIKKKKNQTFLNIFSINGTLVKKMFRNLFSSLVFLRSFTSAELKLRKVIFQNQIFTSISGLKSATAQKGHLIER